MAEHPLQKRAKRLTAIEHLEELRTRLLVVLAVVGLFSVVAYFFSEPLLEFLTSPLRDLANAELYFHAPYEAFLARLKVALLAGFVAGSPALFAELWLFTASGLRRRERKLFFLLVSVSVVLFFLGAAFAFWVVVPAALKFLLNFQTYTLRPLLGIGSYFSFLTGMIVACGVLFDLPVILLGLVRSGILNREGLRRARKGVIVLAFLAAAILTPTPDPIGQIFLAVPLILLYEGCIGVSRWVEKR
jgi:sec-independent protein translocase protein TatC